MEVGRDDKKRKKKPLGPREQTGSSQKYRNRGGESIRKVILLGVDTRKKQGDRKKKRTVVVLR